MSKIPAKIIGFNNNVQKVGKGKKREISCLIFEERGTLLFLLLLPTALFFTFLLCFIDYLTARLKKGKLKITEFTSFRMTHDDPINLYAQASHNILRL